MLPTKNTVILLSLCASAAAFTGAPVRDHTALPNVTSLDPQSIRMGTSANVWTAKPSMLTPRRSAVASGLLKDFIFVVGGRTFPTVSHYPLATTEVYHPLNNTWSPRKPLPQGRAQSNGASLISGKVYVAGGYAQTATTPTVVTSTLYVYDFLSNTWAKKANMPYPGAAGAQAVINGALYVYSGTTNVYNHHRFARYDPASNTWVSLTAPPSLHEYPAAGMIKGKFYLAGGMMNGSDDANPAVHAYDPLTDTWETMAPMPAPTGLAASAVVKGKLYVAGGGPDGAGSVAWTTLQVFDPATNTWSTKAPMPTARTGAAGVAVSGKLLVIGGEGAGDAPLAVVEAYNPGPIF